MSNSTDPFASFRSQLRSAVRAAIDDLGHSHREILHEQVQSLEPDADLAGLCCLLASSAAGGRVEDSMPAATALALLGGMERTFLDLAVAEGSPGLQATWGMPRHLNAGDAFYNLAHSTLLDGVEAMDTDVQLRLLALLDTACRAAGQSLYRPDDKEQRRLIVAAALTMGGILAEADPDTLAALALFGLDLDVTYLADLPPPGLQQLKEGARYLVEVAGL